MSSYKKLRLDPETPIPGTSRSLSSQPGASDSGGGRGYMDSSSFSSSTSGGSSSYMRSAGPFRTRYSQPLRLTPPHSASLSRFSPYYFGKERRNTLRVPLIRARRDDSDSDGNRPSSRASLNSSIGGDSTSSATTSTAQRIIETLQNLSTPVMNAGKIRIDQDIKTVQPLPFGTGSTLMRYSPGSSRSTGPPKLCSSLLLSNPSPANQISPVSNISEQRRLFCIPKMVDVATNTDREVALSPSQAHKSIEFRTSIPPTPSQSILGKIVSKPINTSTSKDDNNSDEEYHECSSEFTFSTAWAPEVFDTYLTNEKKRKLAPEPEKKTSMGPPPLPPPILNGFKDATSSTSTTKHVSFALPPSTSKPAGPGTSTSTFTGFGTGGSSFGASPLKRANTSDQETESVPSKMTSITSSSDAKPTPVAALSNTFAFGSSQSASNFSFGKTSSASGNDKSAALQSLDKVDAATATNKKDNVAPTTPMSLSSSTTSKPAFAPLAAKPAGTIWRCPTCMADNKVDATMCVCCSEKNPNPVVSTAPAPVVPAPAKKKWSCPTCMVDNEIDASECVCCSEKNPNGGSAKKVETASLSAPASDFKFGFGSAMGAGVALPQAGSGTFSFGTPASGDAQKTPVGGFKFGAPSMPAAPASTASSTATSSAPATLSVPIPTTSATSLPLKSLPTSTDSPFKFGSNAPSTNLPTSKPSFGFSSTPSTTTQPALTTSTATISNIFGKPVPTPEKSSNAQTAAAPSFGSSFQSSTTQSNTPASFNFGATPSATSSDTQKITATTTPSFAFGAAAAPKPAFGSFSFGNNSQQTPAPALSTTPSSILSPTTPISTPAPAPAIGATPGFGFGSTNPPTASPFGQIQPSATGLTTQPASSGMFNFGGAPTPNRMNPPAPASSFSLTPNLNFGSTPGSTIPFGNPTQPTPNAGSQSPPALFQFSAAPSESPGGRKIKKAVRRFNK